MRKIFLLILLSVFLSPQAFAKNVYVAKNGNDSVSYPANDINNPWMTIDHGNDTMQCGDTLYVRAGTYQETVTISSGCSGSYKTIQNYTGESPILDGNNKSISYGLNIAGGVNYIKIIGLEVREFANSGIYTWNSTQSYLVIQNNAIHDNGNGSSYDGNIVLHGDLDNCTIDNNIVYNGDAGQNYGIGLWMGSNGTSSNNTISNNLMYLNPTLLKQGSYYHAYFEDFANSTIHDNYFFFSPKSVRFDQSCNNNTFYNNIFAYQAFVGLDIHGNSRNNVLKNNIFAYNGVEGTNTKSSGTSNNNYYNNIFYANSWNHIYQNDSASTTGYQNNIFAQGKTGITLESGSSGTRNYNNFSGLVRNGSVGDNPRYVDPVFTDVDNFDFTTNNVDLQNTGNNPSGDCDEIGLCTIFVDPTRIFPYRTVTVHSSSGGGTPSRSIDHRSSLYASTSYSWVTGTQTPWIVYDMGSSKAVQYLGISGTESTSTWPNGFNIQISDDATNWTTILTNNTISPDTETQPQWFDAGQGYTGRYVKLNVTSSRGSNVNLNEFYIVGPLAATSIAIRPNPPKNFRRVNQ